jgi:formylglycine-generating enzyme required for sulfatase activity
MEPVPAGTFLMGSPAGEPGRDVCEGPRTRVTLSRPFWLGRTTVTHAQWRAVMGTDLPAQARKAFPGEADVGRFLANTDGEIAMHYVSWDDAMAFCGKLNARARPGAGRYAGYAYTLPTEAQWEYACRAGTSEATYAGALEVWGRSNAPVLDAIAWYGGNSSVGYRGTGWDTSGWSEKQYPGGFAGPRDVALKQANAWGLCDMLGNVYQWCLDYPATSLPGGAVTDPAGLPGGSDHAVRGGCWHSDAVSCRAASRPWNVPGDRTLFVGFRVAFSPAPAGR